jgi:hypothetical protein
MLFRMTVGSLPFVAHLERFREMENLGTDSCPVFVRGGRSAKHHPWIICTLLRLSEPRRR